MMACGLMAFFLEHFSMELHQESAENLYEKLINCKRHLLLTICELAPGFVSHVVSSDAGDDDADPQHVATLNEHFVVALMFTFCSDSPSVMIKLRRLCIQDIEFMFAFDCSSHALHNLCMDLVKEFPVVKLIVKQIVFLVKSVRKTHLIQQLFDKICKEKYGITLVLILFTKTCWGTVRDAAKRLNQVRTVMCQLLIEIMSNDLDVNLPNDLKDLILTATFWKGVAAVEVLFSAICSCLSYLEGDKSTFSSVYACFLAIAHHFRTLPLDVRATLDDSVYSHLKKPFLAIHKMLTGASAGERNHKSANQVHSCNRSRLATGKVKAGTAIVFNAQQLTRRTNVGRNGPFVQWLRKLGADVADAARIDEENNKQEDRAEDAQESNMDDHLNEFNEIDLSDGLNRFSDEMLFDNIELEGLPKNVIPIIPISRNFQYHHHILESNTSKTFTINIY
jgi:hypothetical protein